MFGKFIYLIKRTGYDLSNTDRSWLVENRQDNATIKFNEEKSKIISKLNRRLFNYISI